jgi:carboxylesterase
MRFLAEGLNEAGYTVRAPLLPGHGSTVRKMQRSTFREWHDCVRTAYAGLRKECRSVAVAGHSMGGVLALLLAEEYPVDAVIALSAPMHLAGARGLLSPFSFLAAPFVPYLSWPGERKYPKDFLLEDHIGYETLPVAKVNDLFRLMRRARRDLFAITAPLMTIQSADDPTVSASSPRIIEGGVSSSIRRHVPLTHSGHLIPLGPERGLVLQSMIDFLRIAISS